MGFYKIVFTIFVMVFLREYPSNAFTLDLYMLHKALPHGLIANRTVTRNSTASTIANKLDFTVFLQ